MNMVGNRRLTSAQVCRARTLHAAGGITLFELARRDGVSHVAMGYLLRG